MRKTDRKKIFYPDTCEIKRSTGNTDDDGNEIFDIIYSGSCGVQYGASGNASLQGMSYQTSPTLIIPDDNVSFQTNDTVVVIDAFASILIFTVEHFESIHYPEELIGTTIWLKHGRL